MNRKDRRAGRTQSGPRAPDGGELFALAVRHHQAGALLEAEELYRQVLAGDRKHFASLHYLGIIALQRGQPQAAIEPIGRALAVNGGVPDCHYNMAFALQALGRTDEAVRHYQEAVRLKPDYTDAHTNLGNALKQLGRHGDAAASYERVVAHAPSAEAHYNLANTLVDLRRMDDAVSHFRRALALKPDLVAVHNNLANALVAQGLPDDALVHFQRALALDPKLIQARINLGMMLLDQGKFDAAATELERAVSIDANFADAHANLGNVRLAQGRLGEAAQCFQRALTLKPDLVEAQNNLGIVLMTRGDFRNAIQCFQSAVVHKPDFIDAYNNLARTFLSIGEVDNALGVLRRALATAETAATKSLFVQSVQRLLVPPDVEDFRSLMIRALSEPWGRTNDLASVAARLVKQDAALKACMARVAQAWPRRLPADELLGPSGLAPISGNRLLRCVLETGPVADLALERLMTALRFAALEIASAEGSEDGGMADFCCALARQCFLNEQVFSHTDEELARARRLRDAVIAALASNAGISELQLAVVASYFPLHTVPGAENLAARTWSEAMTGVIRQHVGEPAQEQRLRVAMPALTEIEDDVSRQVQQQYEENPYPRWANAEPPGPPLPFDRYLRRKLPAAVFRAFDKPQIEVLIAGCGTGQHAIETAQRFSGATVLAVDLSRTSLAYAERRSRELGRSNIAYGRADILKLGSLGRSFDLIESSGVLHHLAEPFAGWRVLLSLLRPGGFMTVGLYSELARAEIVAARAFIAERGYRATAEDIRRCRQELLDDAGRFARITESADFFSTSGCRDLLFHVQEHRLTIPQIATFLAENDLAFIGFDLDPATQQRYRARFPDDPAMTDLASWDMFEREHPDTFVGMYQFWVQKAA